MWLIPFQFFYKLSGINISELPVKKWRLPTLLLAPTFPQFHSFNCYLTYRSKKYFELVWEQCSNFFFSLCIYLLLLPQYCQKKRFFIPLSLSKLLYNPFILNTVPVKPFYCLYFMNTHPINTDSTQWNHSLN